MADPLGAVLLVAFAFSLPCLWPVYKGWQRRERYLLVRDTPVVTPATATPGETVVVTGTVDASSRATGPLSGEEAPLAAWRIREWSDETRYKYWTTEAHGLRVGDLRVAGEGDALSLPDWTDERTLDDFTRLAGDDTVTGLAVERTVVEVDGFDTDFEVAQADDPPERVRDAERAVGVDPPEEGATLVDLGRTHGTRRYQEARVESDDTLSVRGTVAAPEEPGGPRRLEPPGEGEGYGVVSTLAPDALAWRYRWAYWKLFYGGIALLVGSVAIVAAVIAA